MQRKLNACNVPIDAFDCIESSALAMAAPCIHYRLLQQTQKILHLSATLPHFVPKNIT